MANTDFSAIGEVIPQASYEIVGRIVPGIVVIISLLAAARGPTQAMKYIDDAVIHPDPALSGWAALLMIVGAYALAFVIDGIWQVFYISRKEPHRRDLRAPSASLKFDVVNQELPKAGAWLTKLHAEINAAQVLIVGWGISEAINTYFLATAFTPARFLLEVGLFVLIVAAVAVRQSITRAKVGTLDNLWFLLEEGALCDRKRGTTAGAGQLR